MNRLTIIAATVVAVLASVLAVPTSLQKRSRIMGGEEAVPHSVPYIAYIEIVNFDDGSVTGGFDVLGALITPNAVLTFATFYTDFIRIELLFGTHIPWPVPDSNITRIAYESDLIIHPDFSQDDLLTNNIAIIRIQEAVELTDIVNIVPLPFDPNNNYVGDLATVSGWGSYEDNPVTSIVLRTAEVRVIANRECSNERLAEDALCTAYDGGKATCFGDKGGPLVSSAGELIGVVVMSDTDCLFGETEGPSYYTRVTSHLSWIVENVTN